MLGMEVKLLTTFFQQHTDADWQAAIDHYISCLYVNNYIWNPRILDLIDWSFINYVSPLAKGSIWNTMMSHCALLFYSKLVLN